MTYSLDEDDNEHDIMRIKMLEIMIICKLCQEGTIHKI